MNWLFFASLSGKPNAYKYNQIPLRYDVKTPILRSLSVSDRPLLYVDFSKILHNTKRQYIFLQLV